MTKKRYDKHSTEFGLWIREVEELSSKKGYIATNIDYVWKNYKTGKWIYLEEKRYMAKVKKWQRDIFARLDHFAKNDENYKGFVLLQFEKTSPDDGKIFWNKEEITKTELIERLKNIVA